MSSSFPNIFGQSPKHVDKNKPVATTPKESTKPPKHAK